VKERSAALANRAQSWRTRGSNLRLLQSVREIRFAPRLGMRQLNCALLKWSVVVKVGRLLEVRSGKYLNSQIILA
jgi:hypothetical protein